MEKRDYDTIFILAICILVAIKIAQASEEDAYTPQQPANMNNFHCGQPEFSTRPILLTKPGYPDQLNVVEDNYLQGFSIIHDNKNSVTIQIFCSAAYDVAIDVHNWNLEPNETLASSHPSKFALVEKNSIHSGIQDEENHLNGNFHFYKFADLTLFNKLGKYVVICSASKCTSGMARSGLGVDSSPTSLRVFPLELHGDDEMEGVVLWSNTFLVTCVAASCFIILVTCGLSLAYVQHLEHRRGIIIATRARRRQ